MIDVAAHRLLAAAHRPGPHEVHQWEGLVAALVARGGVPGAGAPGSDLRARRRSGRVLLDQAVVVGHEAQKGGDVGLGAVLVDGQARLCRLGQLLGGLQEVDLHTQPVDRAGGGVEGGPHEGSLEVVGDRGVAVTHVELLGQAPGPAGHLCVGPRDGGGGRQPRQREPQVGGRDLHAQGLLAATGPLGLAQHQAHAPQGRQEHVGGLGLGQPGQVAPQDHHPAVHPPHERQVLQVVGQGDEGLGRAADLPVGAQVRLPGGPGPSGGQQGQQHEGLRGLGLHGAADGAGQHRHGRGHGQLPGLGAVGEGDLAHGVAALAVGVLVAVRGPPGGQLLGGLLLQAQQAGHRGPLAVDDVHGGAFGAVELLEAGLELAHLVLGDLGVGAGHGHRPLEVPAQGAHLGFVEQLWAPLVAGQVPHEGRQRLPLLVALLIGLRQGQPGGDPQVLVAQGVRPADGLRDKGRGLGAVAEGSGVGQALEDVFACGHGVCPSGRSLTLHRHEAKASTVFCLGTRTTVRVPRVRRGRGSVIPRRSTMNGVIGVSGSFRPAGRSSDVQCYRTVIESATAAPRGNSTAGHVGTRHGAQDRRPRPRTLRRRRPTRQCFQRVSGGPIRGSRVGQGTSRGSGVSVVSTPLPPSASTGAIMLPPLPSLLTSASGSTLGPTSDWLAA